MVGKTSASGVSSSICCSNCPSIATSCAIFSALSAGVSRNKIEFRSHFSGTMPFSRR
ncbi:hypothetical protein D3C81_1965830 [compost metagenome]